MFEIVTLVTVSTYVGKAHSVWFLIHMIQTAAQMMAYIMILACALVNAVSVSHVTFFWDATSKGTEQTIPGLAQAESHLSFTVETQVQAVDKVKPGQVFLLILWLYSKSFHQCSILMLYLITICFIQTY